MCIKYIVLPEGLSFSKVFSVKPEPITTLWFMLAEVPDHRRAQGRRHPLQIVLCLGILALCCGHLSYQAMSEWSENYQEMIETHLPFLTGHTPDAATFHRVFSGLNVLVFEEVVGEWLRAIIPMEKGEGIALDGKTLHGTGLHIVAAFAQKAMSVLFEMGTETKGKELVVGPEVLRHITVRDRVVTGDALFAQKTLCQQITRDGGGYVFRVKGNQETLEENIRLFFRDPPFKEILPAYTTIDRWKGQIEKRVVTVSSSPQLLAFLNWPGLTHVWQMKKTVTRQGKITSEEISVGIAGLPWEILGAKQAEKEISEYIRGHWGIEIRLHRQRDVVFNEDHATIRKGHAPQTMAILRNIVTSIFHRATVRNFKTAMRRFQAKPDELFYFLGLTEVAKKIAYA